MKTDPTGAPSPMEFRYRRRVMPRRDPARCSLLHGWALCSVVVAACLVIPACADNKTGVPTTPPATPPPTPTEPPAPAPAPADPALVTTPERLALAEGETTTFTVRLAAPPTAPVLVGVTVQSRRQEPYQKPAAVRITEGSRLTFDPATWNTEQTVTVTAEQDFDAEDDEASIYLDSTSDDPDYENLPRRVLLVEVSDDESYGYALDIYGFFLGIPPLGGTWTYGVGLDGMPAGDVTLTVTSSDPSLIRVTEGATLFFTPDDFSVAQPYRLKNVGLRGYEDSVVIQLEAHGGGYDGVSDAFYLWPGRNFGASALTLSDEDIFLTEGGDGGFSVRLAREPAAEVIVHITNFDPEGLTMEGQREGSHCFNYECTDVGLKKLTFTPEDWRTEQEVVLTAHQDDDTRDESMILELRPTTDDPDFDARPFGSRKIVTVTIADDDNR